MCGQSHTIGAQLLDQHRIQAVHQRTVTSRRPRRTAARTATTAAAAPDSATAGRARRIQILVVAVRQRADDVRVRAAQHKVHAGRAVLAQLSHALQQLVPVLRRLHADCVQIGVAHLLADLQIVVAVVEKTFGVLGQAEGAQPLAHDVAGGHRAEPRCPADLARGVFLCLSYRLRECAKRALNAAEAHTQSPRHRQSERQLHNSSAVCAIVNAVCCDCYGCCCCCCADDDDDDYYYYYCYSLCARSRRTSTVVIIRRHERTRTPKIIQHAFI